MTILSRTIFMLLLAGAPAGAQNDTLSGVGMDELRQRVEDVEKRKQQLVAQARKEREMLTVVQEATGVLMDHYRTLRILKEKNLTVAVLDSTVAGALADAAARIKSAQEAVIGAADPQQVQLALDVTAQAVRNLETVVSRRAQHERELLAEAPSTPVEELRVRAIETMNDLKKGLSGRIKAENSTQKLMIRNMGGLKANLMDIDNGIRSMEKAGTPQRVGEVLAEIGFDQKQLQLIDRELGLNGARGRQIIQSVADRDPVSFRQKALLLMEGMRDDVKKKIKAEYSGNKDEIDQITRLEAKLKRVDNGILEVERAGTGQKLGALLAEIQLDLGKIDRLRTGNIPPVQPPPAAAAPVPAEPETPAAADAGDTAEPEGMPAVTRAVPEPPAGPAAAPRTDATPDPAAAAVVSYLESENHQRMVVWALVVLGALFCSLILSLRNLYLRD